MTMIETGRQMPARERCRSPKGAALFYCEKRMDYLDSFFVNC